MVSHSYYEEDPRVRREAEALVASGRPVEVFALRQPGSRPRDEIDGVRLHRLDVQRHQGAGLPVYLAEYVSFLARAGWAVTAAHRRMRYALLQVHTIPDVLALAGLPLKLAGVPLVVDFHEAMPEFFRSRFPGAANPVAHALLRGQERLAIALADAVITVNDALGDRLVRLGVPREKITIVLNSPALARFDPARHPARGFAEDGVLRLVYAGALSPVYELDVVFAALARLAAARPDLSVTLDLYGRDYEELPLAALATSLGLGDRVRFHGRIPVEDVPAAIAAADIGIAPTRRDEFTDFSLSTKLLEYAAMGKPVVASRLPMVERTFPPATVATYSPGDPEDLARAILGLVDAPADREARVRRSAERVGELAWEREAVRYTVLVERLALDGRGRGPAGGHGRAQGMR
jgi:glycosyltransferase involved in cell wall biosynthesis